MKRREFFNKAAIAAGLSPAMALAQSLINEGMPNPDQANRNLLMIVAPPFPVLSKMDMSEALDAIELLIKKAKANPNQYIRLPSLDKKSKEIIEVDVPLLTLMTSECLRMGPLKRKILPMMEKLIECGADVNARVYPIGENGETLDIKGDTPLIKASRLGQDEVAELLIKHKAEINAVDAEGNSALHYAYATRNPEMQKKLTEAGANKELKNKKGIIPSEMPPNLKQLPTFENMIAQQANAAETRSGRS